MSNAIIGFCPSPSARIAGLARSRNAGILLFPDTTEPDGPRRKLCAAVHAKRLKLIWPMYIAPSPDGLATHRRVFNAALAACRELG